MLGLFYNVKKRKINSKYDKNTVLFEKSSQKGRKGSWDLRSEESIQLKTDY